MNDLTVIKIHEIDSPADLKANVDAIKAAMQLVMKSDVHYGLIPGCGDKPALLQPGAHKLGLMFNLAPEYVIERDDLPSGHREYEVTCKLTHRGSDRFVGEGVGVCTTMEGKYRYRSENTGVIVPSEYWNNRDPDLLGGPGFTVRKKDGKWFIFHRIEHDNPADYYNTVKKIGKKRAYNDAILTATGASDIFQPDDETETVVMERDQDQGNANNDDPRPAVQQPTATNQADPNALIQDGALRILNSKLERAGISAEAVCKQFGIKSINKLPQASTNDAFNWIGLQKS